MGDSRTETPAAGPVSAISILAAVAGCGFGCVGGLTGSVPVLLAAVLIVAALVASWIAIMSANMWLNGHLAPATSAVAGYLDDLRVRDYPAAHLRLSAKNRRATSVEILGLEQEYRLGVAAGKIDNPRVYMDNFAVYVQMRIEVVFRDGTTEMVECVAAREGDYWKIDAWLLA